MTHPLNSLIESRLREAEENGAFENLAGAGKPIPNLQNPKDALLDHLMGEGPVKLPVVVLREQIVEAKTRLAALTDGEARRSEMKILSDLQMRLAMEIEDFRRYG